MRSKSSNSNVKKFAMTHSTGSLATAKLASASLAALVLALSSPATDASAQGLFGWRSKSAETSTAAPANQAPAANPANKDASPTDLESALVKAQLARRVGDYAEAGKILSQLVLFAPDDPRVMGEYGKVQAAQGRADDAQAFLERAIQLQPNEWSFYSALGVALDQKGEYAAAQAAYTRALALKPGEPAALNNAALSYLQSGDIETADRMIQEAAATSTDKGRIQYTIALVERLKATRPARPLVQTPAPVAPAPSPAIVASVAPAPQPPVAAAEPPAAEPIIETMPVVSSALPPLDAEPIEMAVDVTPAAEAPALPALASLQANPTVMMQAVPKDDLAGPVQLVPPKTEAPALKPAIDASPVRRQLAVSANPPLTTRTTAQVEPAPAPKAAAVHAYFVQAGAFATEDRADKLAATLDSMGARVSPTTVGGRSLYRVRIGPFKDAQQANDALSVAKSMGHADVKVVAE